MYLLDIALDLPIQHCFSYSCETNLDRGTRVLVSIYNKKMVGFVWQNSIDMSSITVSEDKIKPVLEVYPEVLPSSILDLVAFTANYYHFPLGQVLFSAIPTRLRKAKVVALRKSAKSPSLIDHTAKPHRLQLNQEQTQVVKQISGHFTTFHVGVLYGITGSGKTEVYLDLIEEALTRDTQILVLVPEINLTPQLLVRFKRRYPDVTIKVLTSHVTERERILAYQAAQCGDAQIIIGTRLAVFTAFSNLGLIIVDEEHDQSFKQQDGLHYSARDIAVWRANYEKIPIVLGSATPSLETLYNYKMGRYTLYKLTNRAHTDAQLPAVKLLDLNTYSVRDGFTEIALDSLRQCLALGELSLVFINRRGYAPLITCYDCAWRASCKNCSIGLVYHNKSSELRCHHCGFVEPVPKSCPSCGSVHLQGIGQGTQRVEEILLQNFPTARIYRIDQDTTSGKGAWDELYHKINNHEVDILVGTQMLAKGHDFHNLTLVVGLNLDSGLYSHDFRASEALFTQLTQVAGRSGRGSKPGCVLLQTRYPRHELYQHLIRHDFGGFVNYLMAERKRFNLPPYSYYALFRASSQKPEILTKFMTKVAQVAQSINIPEVIIHSPVPSVMRRLNGREREQMLLQSNVRHSLHEYLTKLVSMVDLSKGKKDIEWHLDVDPSII